MRKILFVLVMGIGCATPEVSDVNDSAPSRNEIRRDASHRQQVENDQRRLDAQYQQGVLDAQRQAERQNQEWWNRSDPR